MGYTQEEFAEKIRVSINSIKNIETGRTIPDVSFYKAVSDFTQIPLNAIQKGTVNSNSIKFTAASEESYKNIDNNSMPLREVVKRKDNNSGIPLVSQEAAAGFGNSHFLIKKEDIQAHYVIPDFNGIDFMIRVKGSSMYPKYSSGDIVACKILKESSFIQWNRTYVISTREQGMLCKRLMPSEKDENSLRFISDNKDYPTFEVSKTDITGIALIVGVIRLE